MYVRRIYVQNNGPLAHFSLEMPFMSEGGDPKPLILVGANGSGKTNLLSIFADCLFEVAAAHYIDVTPTVPGGGRHWFRVNGGLTTRHGAAGSCALVELEDSGASIVYKDKAGRLDANDLRGGVHASFHAHLNWAVEGGVKECAVAGDVARKIFEEGVYLFLPASRAETPHWLNRSSVPEDEVDLSPRISGRMRKPIYVERGLALLKQWLLALLIDTRVDAEVLNLPGPANGAQMLLAKGDVAVHSANMNAWKAVNDVLKIVLDDPSARLGWAGRRSGGRLGIVTDKHGGLLAIDSLSTGQATLLNMFGTLLRYGDTVPNLDALTPGAVKGVCIIDEVDAHMHVDLQYRALPALMRMFPKIQFIVASHSPLFALGMDRAYGASGACIVDMPLGVPIAAEAYSEFGKAMDALRETQAFGKAVLEFAGKEGKLSVLLEGETDPIYLNTAVQLLGRADLAERVEFAWVGAKDPESGQGFNTGKDALTLTAKVFRAKPELVKHPVLLLYDNDVPKEPADLPLLYIRSMPTNPGNKVVRSGIENLLPEASIDESMFSVKESQKGNGTRIVTTTLDKMKLCTHLCHEKRDVGDFHGFGAVLDIVAAISQAVPLNVEPSKAA